MFVNWDMNSLCVCHCSLTNDSYNKAEVCVCILVYRRKWPFIIFCIWLPLTKYRRFFLFWQFTLELQAFFVFFIQFGVIPLHISRLSIWFCIKIVCVYIWFFPCCNTERLNKEGRQRYTDGILFPTPLRNFVRCRLVAD